MTRQISIHAATILSDARWAAVVARDPLSDGHFFYSVRTTGVYCRPSCGARTPRPENVDFHPTTESAEQAGFRPCKRCRPDQPPLAERQAARVAELCRWIDAAETPPSLAELAERAGLSAYHLHRLFKAVTGVTPKAYAEDSRARKLRAELGGKGTVTEAIYKAGYNSSGRFYAESERLLGMTPRDYKAGGVNARIRFAVGASSLGDILVAASERGICAILMGDDPENLVRNLQDLFPNADLVGGDTGFEAWVARVVGFVEMPKLGLDLPLDVRGTAFQMRVWQALREIPAGETATYSEIAERLGMPRAARAVARACATNVLAVAIPCHRVIRNDGGLAAYRWGIERKRNLIEREAEG